MEVGLNYSHFTNKTISSMKIDIRLPNFVAGSRFLCLIKHVCDDCFNPCRYEEMNRFGDLAQQYIP